MLREKKAMRRSMRGLRRELAAARADAEHWRNKHASQRRVSEELARRGARWKRELRAAQAQMADLESALEAVQASHTRAGTAATSNTRSNDGHGVVTSLRDAFGEDDGVVSGGHASSRGVAAATAAAASAVSQSAAVVTSSAGEGGGAGDRSPSPLSSSVAVSSTALRTSSRLFEVFLEVGPPCRRHTHTNDAVGPKVMWQFPDQVPVPPLVAELCFPTPTHSKVVSMDCMWRVVLGDEVLVTVVRSGVYACVVGVRRAARLRLAVVLTGAACSVVLVVWIPSSVVWQGNGHTWEWIARVSHVWRLAWCRGRAFVWSVPVVCGTRSTGAGVRTHCFAWGLLLEIRVCVSWRRARSLTVFLSFECCAGGRSDSVIVPPVLLLHQSPPVYPIPLSRVGGSHRHVEGGHHAAAVLRGSRPSCGYVLLGSLTAVCCACACWFSSPCCSLSSDAVLESVVCACRARGSPGLLQSLNVFIMLALPCVSCCVVRFAPFSSSSRCWVGFAFPLLPTPLWFAWRCSWRGRPAAPSVTQGYPALPRRVQAVGWQETVHGHVSSPAPPPQPAVADAPDLLCVLTQPAPGPTPPQQVAPQPTLTGGRFRVSRGG